MEPCDGSSAPFHLPTVVTARRLRDLLVETWWVRCFDCGLRLGPFASSGIANFVFRMVATNSKGWSW